MKPERWQQIERLYNSALELESAQREGFLKEACAGNESLRKEVERLLARRPEAEGFMESPALEVAAKALAMTQAEEPHPDLVGRSLLHYRIVEEIGEGGMGVVYKARDTRLNRFVAVKVLSAGKVADPNRVRRFIQEAQAASALNHPNIVTIHDIGSENRVDFIAMEFVAGETLSAVIPRQGMPVDQALNISAQMADALAAAHASGIIHRDLKPGNVMLTADTRVKLLDFGLAKLLENPNPGTTSLTVEGAVLGTVAYMSPEQVQGRPADTCSDIFSFGAVLYEMLSGRRAFPGDSTASVTAAILRDEPAPLKGVLPELAAIVSRCLRKNPAERYERVSDVRSALERLRNLVGSASRESEPSLAVLPFTNLSADKENEYFSDGLAEEILNALMRVPGLKVTARTSAFAFRGKEQDVRKIGEALDVRTILEGSVRRAGNRIRVTAQLVNASNGYHLWSERYDREMTDVFAVQDEISQAIVGMLKPRLMGEKPVSVRQTANIEAYHAYLKGCYHYTKVSPQAAARSKAYFEEAIALDPEYAPAYVGLARCFFVASTHGSKPPREGMPRAKATALKALQLDELESEAHMVLGLVAGMFDYDWNEALRQCRLALLREPVSVIARQHCAQFILIPLRRFDEAIAVLEPALKADPLSPFPRVTWAAALGLRGSDERAIQELHRLLEFQEDFWLAYFNLGRIYTHKGKVPEAIAALEKGLQLAPWFPPLVGLLAGNYARAGNRARAESLLARLAAPELAHVGAFGYGVFYVLCSEFDLAVDQFEKAIEARDPSAVFLGCDPFLESFRTFPRRRAMLQKMNLADVGS